MTRAVHGYMSNAGKFFNSEEESLFADAEAEMQRLFDVSIEMDKAKHAAMFSFLKKNRQKVIHFCSIYQKFINSKQIIEEVVEEEIIEEEDVS